MNFPVPETIGTGKKMVITDTTFLAKRTEIRSAENYAFP